MKKILFVCFCALAAVNCFAATSPVLYITDGTNSILADSSGTCTTTGTASCGSVSVTAGSKVTLTGATLAGVIAIDSARCQDGGTIKDEDFLFSADDAGGSATIYGYCSGTGNTDIGTVTLTGNGSGTSFSVYANPSDAFCPAIPPGTQGGIFNCAGAGVTVIGPVAGNGSLTGAITSEPYSLTTVVTLALPSNDAIVGGDFRVQVAPAGNGCPATPGFWKNASKHPFPGILVFPVSIGGITYSASDFYFILGNPGGGNAAEILGYQLVAALINIAAGAQTNTATLNAINQAETDLTGISLKNPQTFVSPSSALGQDMTVQGGILANYNNGFFGSCNDGTGLTLGGGAK